MFQFAHPEAFYLFGLLPVLWLARLWQRRRPPTLRFSDVNRAAGVRKSWRQKFSFFPEFLRLLVFSFLILGMARPQKGTRNLESSTSGIDIMLVMDISGSMKAEDFHPQNRLYVAKQVTRDFIMGRQTDRIGLVIFAKESFTQCPLTIDYGVLLNLLGSVRFGLIEDGTAIGMGLINGVNRLKDSPAKNKVIILLTDGANNAGPIDPLTAAGVAQALGIKVYTIGIGRPGLVPMPVDDPVFGRRYMQVQSDLDEPTLQKMARLTGGRFFRAKDPQALARIFEEIDALEKTKIKVKEFWEFDEKFRIWALLALSALVLELFLSGTVFRRLP
ncbi:MAG: VWA domain-containing protein [candidate division Zixibacteria bacterium]|nr:VWA domain-containing protein [candidate division Zixibacteria bacterium]